MEPTNKVPVKALDDSALLRYSSFRTLNLSGGAGKKQSRTIAQTQHLLNPNTSNRVSKFPFNILSTNHNNSNQSPPASTGLMTSNQIPAIQEFQLLDNNRDLILQKKKKLQKLCEQFKVPLSPSKELHTIILFPQTRIMLYQFLEKNYCEENLEFFIDVQRLKDKFKNTTTKKIIKSPDSPMSSEEIDIEGKIEEIKEKNQMKSKSYELHNEGLEILSRYLTDEAIKPINIDFQMRKKLIDSIEESIENLLASFTQAQNTIFSLLLMDSFARFKLFEPYKDFLAQVLNNEIDPLEYYISVFGFYFLFSKLLFLILYLWLPSGKRI